MPNVPGPMKSDSPPPETVDARDAAPFDPWALFDDLPVNVSVVGAGERVTYANRAWHEAFNPGSVSLGEVVVAEMMHPADVAATRDAWSSATTAGAIFTARYRVRGRRGEYRWYAVRGAPTFAAADGSWRYAVVATDIDDAHRYEAYLALLAEIGALVASAPDPDSALAQIGTRLVPLAGACFAVYRPDAGGTLVPTTFVHADRARGALARELWRAYPQASRRLPELAARSRGPVVVAMTAETRADLAADDAHLAMLAAYGARDVVLVPIVGRDASHGVLGIETDRETERSLGDAEVRLATEIARRIAIAFDSASLASEGRRAADDLRFLARVGETMVESLDLETRLARLVHAVVPRLADWATVNLVTGDDSVETVAIAHRDPTKAEIAERLRGPYYGNPDSRQGTPVALRSGRSRLMSGVGERVLREHLRPETYDDVVALGADCAFVVPLLAGGAVYGTMAAMRGGQERPFNENDMWLMEELARRAAVAIDNARRYAHHTTVAEAFQVASLPSSLPQTPGLVFSAFYAPGKREATVGGDWYDAFALDDGRLVVSIGDVSGSGLPAAVIMGSVRQIVRGAAQLDGDPRVILRAADRALRSQFPSTMVTAFVGVIDLVRGEIVYASAGHPPPLLRVQDGTLVELATPGLPLGLRDDDEPPSGVSRYEAGALLVLYTDGLIESTRDIIAGDRALRAAFADVTVRTAGDVASAIVEAVLRDGAHDDVAILTIGRT